MENKRELEKIDKEIRRAIFIVRYKKLIIRSVIIVFLIILALIVGINIYNKNKPRVECIVDGQCSEGYICREGKCVVSPELLPPSDLKIQILDQAVIKSGSDKFDIAVRVKNPDLDWGIKELKYSFVFSYSGSGTSSQKKFEGKTYILPNEEKYIIHLGAEGVGDYSDFDIVLEPITWRKLSRFTEPALDVKNIISAVSNDGVSKYKTSANITNNSDYDFERVDIFVILRNSDEKMVGVNATNINAFLRSTRRDVILQWYTKINGTVDNTEFYVEADVFSSENFINRFGHEKEVFQQFIIEEENLKE